MYFYGSNWSLRRGEGTRSAGVDVHVANFAFHRLIPFFYNPVFILSRKHPVFSFYKMCVCVRASYKTTTTQYLYWKYVKGQLQFSFWLDGESEFASQLTQSAHFRRIEKNRKWFFFIDFQLLMFRFIFMFICFWNSHLAPCKHAESFNE